MNWTFIICTHNPNQERIEDSINTILDLRIPKFEVIVIGGGEIKNQFSQNIRFIPFDESSKPGWITKKKNHAAQLAKFENLCILHDYYAFDKDWFAGWGQISDDWDICCNKISLINGVRDWTDWCLWDHPTFNHGPISYDEENLTNFQYVSGGFFCVKKDFILKHPLNEDLVSHGEEDVEWSLRVRNFAKIKFNKHSSARHLKFHRNMKKWRKYFKGKAA
jgi:glycosyltransferase involved in cell wall biosynthesis